MKRRHNVAVQANKCRASNINGFMTEFQSIKLTIESELGDVELSIADNFN